MAAGGDFSKQIVARTPEVAGGLLRQIIEFAIDGNTDTPSKVPSCAR